MKKVVISGASGFIGSAVATDLLKAGQKVYGLGLDLKERTDLLSFHNFVPIEIEFEEYKYLVHYIREDEIDVFYHFAWQGGFEKEALKNYELQLKNAKYACDAIHAAIQIHSKRFVYAASINEIEIQQFINNFDSFSTRPTCIYASAKLVADLICRTIAQENHLYYNAGIIPMLYGKGNLSKQLVNVILTALIHNETPKLIEGNNLYDLVSIKDVARAFVIIGEQGKNGKRYYIGHRRLKTFREWIQDMGQIVNPSISLRFGEYKDPLNLDYSLIDLDELYRDTGFECQEEFSESIWQTVTWLKQQEEKQKSTFSL